MSGSPDAGTTLGTEIVEVISEATRPRGRWDPLVGTETQNLLGHFKLPDSQSRRRVRDEALAVLRLCVPPTDSSGTDTGLVIGHIQSGKTMSFTTVAALARDNNYRMMIVITGVSKPLLNQSEERLKKDLRLGERPDRKWKHFGNPRIGDRPSIQSALDEWSDPDVPVSERQTILITVMKNHVHLRHLNKLLGSLNLQGVPVLVVDDEADQAGLNSAVRRSQESSTYRQLVALRKWLPHHSFLQYTATPQAPLLINIIDLLSPRFTVLLTPGGGYIGGREFFEDNPHLVQPIPLSDIPARGNQLIEPPASLLAATRLFYLGVAASYCLEATEGNRSMLVHPSQQTHPHALYVTWVTQIQAGWVRILKLDERDPDRVQLLSDFEGAYGELKGTVCDLPAFADLVRVLPRAINKTIILEVNATKGKTPDVNWRSDFAHILVGGQAMDRGFTVEGLTVTYMPRDVGLGNADTVQQRARFFGYKASYLGYCRIFLGPDTLAAYRAYVEHEEDIRERLATHARTAAPLSEWKRAFFLDGSLRPTRDAVISLAYMRGSFSDDWYAPKAPHDSDEAVASNRQTVLDFVSEHKFLNDSEHPEWTPAQRHAVASGISLREALEKLLTRFRTTRLSDSQRFTGLLIQIQRYLEEHPDSVCTVYHMSGGSPRKRTADDKDEIPNLFQGENPDENGNGYPGNRAIRGATVLTVQIYNLNVVTKDDGRQVTIADVPALAVWVPRVMSADWVSQPQGGKA